jgi:pSer/pThr/pTyr-binding forkhead associated (FHA) protein
MRAGFPPASAEDASPRARLVIIAKDGGEGPSYPVGEVLDIGRTEGDVLIADDRYLSPRHARVVRRNGRLHLRDLNSTNGLYLRLRSTRSSFDATPPSSGSGSGHARIGASQGRTEGSERNEPRAAEAERSGDRNGERSGERNAPSERSMSLGHPLRDQDLLLVGQQVLRFEVVNDADEGLGPASQHGTLLFGSPAAPRYARLCQRTVEGVTRDVFYIRKAETVLGRESGDVVFTEDPFLSRRHAALRVEKDPRRFLLTDLGSSNGTFVQVRNEVALESGDQFRIGQQLFRIDIA